MANFKLNSGFAEAVPVERNVKQETKPRTKAITNALFRCILIASFFWGVENHFSWEVISTLFEYLLLDSLWSLDETEFSPPFLWKWFIFHAFPGVDHSSPTPSIRFRRIF